MFRFTYEVAPVFTLMEDVVLERMRCVIGWPCETGDGIFAPGRVVYLIIAYRFSFYRAAWNADAV